MVVLAYVYKTISNHLQHKAFYSWHNKEPIYFPRRLTAPTHIFQQPDLLTVWKKIFNFTCLGAGTAKCLHVLDEHTHTLPSAVTCRWLAVILIYFLLSSFIDKNRTGIPKKKTCLVGETGISTTTRSIARQMFARNAIPGYIKTRECARTR